MYNPVIWRVFWYLGSSLLALGLLLFFFLLAALDLSSGVQVSLAIHGEQALVGFSHCGTQA